jgi:acid stress-induced BolA-like protein IbaG/YrbA
MTDITLELEKALASALPGAQIQISAGSGGHFSIAVVSALFEGKSSLQKQRMVLSPIAHLMKGEGAPVHAIDSIKATLP